MELCNLPVVILHEILDHIPARADLAHLAQASTWLQNLCSPRLYRRLEFTLTAQPSLKLCESLLAPDRRQDWTPWVRSVLVVDEVEEEWQEPVICGIAKVLEKLAPVGLYEFEWDSRDVPHPDIVSALLGLHSLSSLKLAMPLRAHQHAFLEHLALRNREHLRSVHIWRIQNDAQMACVDRALAAAEGLKDLSLCVAGDRDWDDDEDEDEDEDEGGVEGAGGGDGEEDSEDGELGQKWMPLPNVSYGRLATIELNGRFNLAHHDRGIPLFNPATLRRLELRQCTGCNNLLASLVARADSWDIEEVVLGSWEDCDMRRVARFVATCGKLQVLLLSLSSLTLTHEAIKALIPAVERSRATLEVLLLEFGRQSKFGNYLAEDALYYQPEWLSPLKSFDKLRELAVALDVVDMNLLEIPSILPPNIRVLDLRLPRPIKEHTHGRCTRRLRALVRAAPHAPYLRLVVISSGDDHDVGSWYEVVRAATSGAQSFPTTVVAVDRGRGAVVAGDDQRLYQLRRD